MSTSNNEAKKGFGPALAAMILAIVGFLTTAITAGVLNLCLNLPEFWDAFAEVFNEMLGSSNVPANIVNFSVKFAFAAYYYDGGLFLLIALICFIVALVKYFKNTVPNKAKSVLVLACIAGVLILASLIIATIGFANASKMIDARFAF